MLTSGLIIVTAAAVAGCGGSRSGRMLPDAARPRRLATLPSTGILALSGSVALLADGAG